MAESKVMWGRSTNMLTRRVYLLHRATHDELLSRLAPLGLSLNQAIAVCYIHDHTGEPVYQRDLECEQGLTNPTITAMVKSMVANDVVYRIRDKNDGRFWQLRLTPHGLDLYEPARDIITSVNEKFEARLTDEELETFYALAAKLLLDDEAEEERARREG
ncbi:MAG: MarR family transcriptional regulator [Atopobiaceae bacterium]|nr:MarR family transcriptional regulator [Atopobiaceae bacterium]